MEQTRYMTLLNRNQSFWAHPQAAEKPSFFMFRQTRNLRAKTFYLNQKVKP